ncbi:MAG: CorA family divalent cation transporter, partial [Bryobacteraceae bacterium]
TGFYGMNLKGLPWSDSPHGAWIAAGVIAASSAALMAVMRLMRWL